MCAMKKVYFAVCKNKEYLDIISNSFDIQMPLAWIYDTTLDFQDIGT